MRAPSLVQDEPKRQTLALDLCHHLTSSSAMVEGRDAVTSNVGCQGDGCGDVRLIHSSVGEDLIPIVVRHVPLLRVVRHHLVRKVVRRPRCVARHYRRRCSESCGVDDIAVRTKSAMRHSERPRSAEGGGAVRSRCGRHGGTKRGSSRVQARPGCNTRGYWPCHRRHHRHRHHGGTDENNGRGHSVHDTLLDHSAVLLCVLLQQHMSSTKVQSEHRGGGVLYSVDTTPAQGSWRTKVKT